MVHGWTATLLWLALGSTAAQPAAGTERMSLPDHYLGLRMQPLLLLTRPDVRADIGIDAAQAAEVDRAVLDFVARAAAVRGLKGPAAVEARREVDTQAQRWLAAHLNEAQYQRLIEVDLQWEGPSALISRPLIADHLELTNEQRQTLSQAVATRNKNRPPGAFRQDVEATLAHDAIAVLTPKQQALWKALLGRRFSPQLADTAHTAARPVE